ncbi:hypothetical protein K457DRAFT_131942 [Linnemannia elongata AG-77]|uniref:Uncharacterized protein n=1 Tax=Linnemannia elongata AG-77 TaxID=1314771 RepID=A0A197KJP8_9FUNG|nr:hypothetical protein K457DRAFT_131942 [Linnemannia elongata AG-77]
MTPCQRFRQGEKEESLAVRKDKHTGDLYSRITDIQRTFPDASRFKVNGVVLNFLEDDNEQEYEPKRIAHYPDDIIEIVVASLVPASSSSLSSTSLSQTISGLSNAPSQLLSTDNIDLTVSNLSLQSLPPPTSAALVPSTSQPLSSSLASPSLAALKTTSLARPMAILSTMALDISQIQHQLTQSADQQSAHHQQLLEQLIHLVAQQNEMLREQAASKEREEQMLREQAESKLREEQMLKMHQETIDRLIVNQQRVDAILVQNYELHEYPIPRLFVVLPDSFSDWDPRNFLMERFRLYFLCECGDNCGSGVRHGSTSGQLSITAAATTSPIPVKNSIHLAKHEGYELSRPTEFFDQYGPYVLGMLRILQHCLAVAAVAAPIAALADGGLKDIMEGVKSISESTIEAVDMSINILQAKLSDAEVADGHERTAFKGQEDNPMFENLAALEGADLRRLGTFLRNKDKDKILGNLYRITTEQGHVKWVCFEHYKETYRHTAMSSFVQSVEAAGGTYDPHLGQVAISLKSGTASKDFFRRLSTQAPAVQSLDVALDWDFKSTDLATFVDMVAKSNVKVVKLDLQDDHTSNATIASMRPGKGRYHSLLGLLSNTKIRSLQLSNIYLLGTRTSNLPSSFSASWLQSFRFHGKVNEDDRRRLTNIISHCTGLVELALICHNEASMDLSLHQAVFNLRTAKRLHLSGWIRDKRTDENWETVMGDRGPMTELICPVMFEDHRFLTKTIRQSGSALKVLVLYMYTWDHVYITPETPSPISHLAGSPSESPSLPYHLSSLTHLDIQVRLSDSSLELLSTVLPRLELTHFGCDRRSQILLQHCNLTTLKSLSILDSKDNELEFMLDTMVDGTNTRSWGGLEQLFIHRMRSGNASLIRFLQCVRPTRLYLDGFNNVSLALVLDRVDFSQLEKVSIRDSHYFDTTEQLLARRTNEFTKSLVLYLDNASSNTYIASGGKTRASEGSPKALPRHRVKLMDDVDFQEHHYRFLQPILPVYTF